MNRDPLFLLAPRHPDPELFSFSMDSASVAVLKKRMPINEQFGECASQERVERAVHALTLNGMDVFVVESGSDAKVMVDGLIPKGAEVMNMTSVTLDAVGLSEEVSESGKFLSLRKQLMAMDREKQSQEMSCLGTESAWVIGSVQAVTEEGQVLIASGSGSQLPAYAYGAEKVVWIVGSQKIVKNLEEGMRRMYEYCLPLEDERARKAYGRGSAVNKILMISKEIKPGRITVIIVKEKLGF